MLSQIQTDGGIIGSANATTSGVTSTGGGGIRVARFQSASQALRRRA
jgi:hypothetical protein